MVLHLILIESLSTIDFSFLEKLFIKPIVYKRASILLENDLIQITKINVSGRSVNLLRSGRPLDVLHIHIVYVCRYK